MLPAGCSTVYFTLWLVFTSPMEPVCPGAGCAALCGLTVFLETPSCCSFRFSTDCTTAAATHVLFLGGRREDFVSTQGSGWNRQASGFASVPAGGGELLFLVQSLSQGSPQKDFAFHMRHRVCSATRAQGLVSNRRQTAPDQQGGSGPSKSQGQRGFSSLLVSGYFHFISCGLSCSFRRLVLFCPAGSCKHFG